MAAGALEGTITSFYLPKKRWSVAMPGAGAGSPGQCPDGWNRSGNRLGRGTARPVAAHVQSAWEFSCLDVVERSLLVHGSAEGAVAVPTAGSPLTL
jgi:hypothetical protein